MFVSSTVAARGISESEKQALIEARAQRLLGVIKEFPTVSAAVEKAGREARQAAIKQVLDGPGNEDFKKAVADEIALMLGAS
jgi:hypothetical protein